MKIVKDLEQRSPEWFEARKGVYTASQFGKWLIDPNKNETNRKAKESTICAMLGDLSGISEPPGFDSWEMKRGRDLEPEAREAYETIKDVKVSEVGFILHDRGRFGCSPDGLIYDRAEDPNRTGMHYGLELKCPVPKTHIKYLREGVVPDSYLCQVHGSLAVTGLERWDFMSYCPELPPLLITVQRDDFTERLLEGLMELSDAYDVAFQELKEMWEKFNSGKEDA